LNKLLLIVVDALRADHLSCYGYPMKTPNIDRLAKQSIFYKNAWSAGSYTNQSLPYLLSDKLIRVLKNNHTMPNIIESNPYVSHYANKKDLMNISISTIKQGYKQKIQRLLEYFMTGEYRGEANAEEINTKTLEIIKKYRPNFVCSWYMDVHSPYFTPRETKLSDFYLNYRFLNCVSKREYNWFSNRKLSELKDNYDACIHYVDKQIGFLLKLIPDDYVVVFTSDHGEEFLEEGDLSHHSKDISALRWVPLMIRLPSRKHEVRNYFDMSDFDELLLEYILME